MIRRVVASLGVVALTVSPAHAQFEPTTPIDQVYRTVPFEGPDSTCSTSCSTRKMSCSSFEKLSVAQPLPVKTAIAVAEDHSRRKPQHKRKNAAQRERRVLIKDAKSEKAVMDELRNILFAIANQNRTCYSFPTTWEEMAFRSYREQAKKNWYELLQLYLNGAYTNADWSQKMFEWFLAYKNQCANCGERGKFAAVAAALRGFLVYDCKANGDHQFAVAWVNGKPYILDPMPTSNASSVIVGPITITPNGSPNGATITMGGSSLGSYPSPFTCNLVYDPKRA